MTQMRKQFVLKFYDKILSSVSVKMSAVNQSGANLDAENFYQFNFDGQLDKSCA